MHLSILQAIADFWHPSGGGHFNAGTEYQGRKGESEKVLVPALLGVCPCPE